jgi:hypothetical protein
MTVAIPAPIAPEASVTPAVSPGFRLVPVSVGRPGRVQVAHLPCPTWCVLDHLAERIVAVEDISHRGDVDHVQVPTMGDALYSAFELYTQLYSDPASEDPRMQIAAVVVTDGSRDAYLAPDMADEMADELIAFAMQVKETAGIARLASESAA